MPNIAPTWVQKNISPVADKTLRVLKHFYLNRAALLWGIRATIAGLDEGERVALKFILKRSGIIQPQFSAFKLKELESYHLGKFVTFRQLSLAAHEFYRLTGRDILLKLCDKILKNDLTDEPDRRFGRIDYRQIYDTHIKPKLLSEMRIASPEERMLNQEVIEQALNFSLSLKHVPKGELNYRIRKIADTWWDALTVISSLFMDIPAERLKEALAQVQSGRLVEYKEMICEVVSSFQALKAEFEFDPAKLLDDEKYVSKKMNGLPQDSDTPRVLMLFLLDRLMEARSAADFRDNIFNQTRFLFAPLAHRLGLIFVADDFRDQALRLLDPRKYDEVEEKIRARIKMGTESAKTFLQGYVKELWGTLQERIGVNFLGTVIKHRVKSRYSVWNKVEERREVSYELIRDILGVKIICASEEAMREICSLLSKKNPHFVIDPKETRIRLDPRDTWRGIKLVGKDYDNGLPIEIQIMTSQMNDENTRGKVSDWQYGFDKELTIIDGEGRARKIKKQAFGRLVPFEMYSPNFVENFMQIKYIADTERHVIPQ